MLMFPELIGAAFLTALAADLYCRHVSQHRDRNIPLLCKDPSRCTLLMRFDVHAVTSIFQAFFVKAY